MPLSRKSDGLQSDGYHSDPAGTPSSRDSHATAPRLSMVRKTAFAALVVMLVVGGAEIVCRLFGLGKLEAVAHYVSDWHETPDGRNFWVVRGPGYNSDGMRDREHSLEKPPGVHRIVCLGDSVTVGHGVKRSESYPFIFESFLKQLGLPVEMFNIAASGWATRQEATAYSGLVRRYRPDHVFLGFCLNDVAEMYNNLTAPPPAVLRFLIRHSALFRWTVNAEAREVRSVEELFYNTDSPAVRGGWESVFADLSRLRKETRADGCDFSVVIFPFRFQLESGSPGPVAQRTLFEFCRRNAIPCLDLLPALRTIGVSAFLDESHLSPTGARIVAEELIRWGRTGCVMCGSDLTGVDADRCPKCGSTIER